MNLKQLQKHFQSIIIEANQGGVIDSTLFISNPDRISIYQNAYYERVINAMKQDFPVLSALIGESAFASMVTEYIKATPSTHFNLRYVGKKLPTFILSRDASLEAYSDLAQLEWMLCEVEIDGIEKTLETRFNVMDVLNAFQEGRVIEFQLKMK